MADFFETSIDGAFDLSSGSVRTALQRGINRGVQRAAPEAKRRAATQGVNAGANVYKAILASRKSEEMEGRVEVKVTRNPLEAFSLTSPQSKRGDKIIRLRLKPGRIVELKNAFFMKVKGDYRIAMRGKPGARLSGRTKPRFFSSKGLLVGFYGPSDDQIFIPDTKDNDKGVAGSMAKWIADKATQEFFRQMELLKK